MRPFRLLSLAALIGPIVLLAAVANAAPARLAIPDGVYGGQVTATLTAKNFAFTRGSVFVILRCAQAGMLVYTETHQVASDGTSGPFTLGPTDRWEGGDADCTGEARLWNGKKWRTVARDTFHVSGQAQISDEDGAPAPTPTPENTVDPDPSPVPSATGTGARGPTRDIDCPAGAVAIAPGASIQSAIDANGTGTAFCLGAGTHTVGSALRPKAGQRFVGKYGAVLTGSARHAFYGSTVPDVRIENLIIEGFPGLVQEAAVDFRNTTGWRLYNNEIRNNGYTGFIAGSRAHVARNVVHHNGQQGGGGGYDSSVIEDNELAWNNPDQKVEWGFSGGGFKSCFTRHIILRGNWVHHNHGPGLWLDCENHGTAERPLLYEGNLVEDNAAMGIFHEITEGVTVVRGNSVRRNGFDPSACAWGYGAGIMVSTSSNVTVTGNEVDDNCRGITLVAQDRGGAQLRNNLVRGNTVTMQAGQWSGAAQDCSCGAYAASSNNVFVGNTYRVPDIGGRWWGWADAARTWDEWRGFGMDETGLVQLQ